MYSWNIRYARLRNLGHTHFSSSRFFFILAGGGVGGINGGGTGVGGINGGGYGG